MGERQYHQLLSKAVRYFWNTKKEQGNVLAGKQMDGFLELLAKVAIDLNVPKDCIYLKINHVPGYFRATKDWDLMIVSPNKHLIAAVELKSQVGSYGNNLNNRTEEALGSSDDFWTAFREKSFVCNQSPWLGYLMLVGKDEQSTRVARVNEPHFPVRPEFKHTTYLDRYRIMCQRLVLEHKYNAVALISSEGGDQFESLDESISFDTFIHSFIGHLLGCKHEFE